MASLKKNSILLIVFAFISRILGFFRDLVLSYKFGASEITDVFLIISNIPIAIFAGISTSLLTTYIPVFHKIETEQSTEEIDKFNSNLINILLLFTLFLLLFLYIFSNPILKIFAIGLKGDSFLLAIKEYNIVIISIIFIAISTVFQGFMQAKEDFRFTILSGPFLNIIIIIGILFSTEDIPYIMAISVLIVYVFYLFLYSIPALKRGFKYKFKTLDFMDKNIVTVIKLMLPIFLGKVFFDINKVIDRSLASTLIIGSVSALSYGDKLINIITQVFPTSIASSIYPRLSKLFIEKKYNEMNRVLEESLKIVSIFIFPLSVMMIVFATPIVKVLFFRGNFSETAVYMTSDALIYYGLGATAIGLKRISEQYFYAIGNMKTPMFNSIIAISINIVLNFILVKSLAHKGIALATSISSVIMCILFFKSLKSSNLFFNFNRFLFFLVKLLVISLIMAFLSKTTFIFIDYRIMNFLFLKLTISAFVGGIAYFILLFVFDYKFRERIRIYIK